MTDTFKGSLFIGFGLFLVVVAFWAAITERKNIGVFAFLLSVITINYGRHVSGDTTIIDLIGQLPSILKSS